MFTQKGNILTLIAIFIALIFVASASFYAGSNYFRLKNEIVAEIVNNPQSSPTPVPTTQDETANWRSYKNNKLNYEFRYPNGFKIYEESPDKVYISNNLPPDPNCQGGGCNLGTPGLSIYFDHIVVPGLPSEDSMSLDEYAKSRLASSQIADNNQTIIQNIQKFGQEARYFEGSDLGYSHHYMIKPNPNLSFSVTANFPSKEDVPTYENLANQILSTFRFTN